MTTTYAQEVTPTWGDALVLAAFHSPGGVNQAVTRIHDCLGLQIGVRNTFSKFLRVESIDQLKQKDRFRAWLLVTALGCDPVRFGLDSSDVPKGYDVPRLELDLLPSSSG